MPVIPATQEAEVGESLQTRRQRLQWAKITPLHSSLGNNSETPSPKKKKITWHCKEYTKSQNNTEWKITTKSEYEPHFVKCTKICVDLSIHSISHECRVQRYKQQNINGKGGNKASSHFIIYAALFPILVNKHIKRSNPLNPSLTFWIRALRILFRRDTLQIRNTLQIHCKSELS